MLYKGKVLLLFLLAGCTTGLVAGIPEESGSIEAFFCDKVDCAEVFKEKTGNASSLSCAFYNLNPGFFQILDGKNAKLVVDEDHPFGNAVVEQGAGLMHNKYCVIDGNFVWTGSWNPSQGMSVPNNVVWIESRFLAKAFQKEFDELSSGVFHGGSSFPGLVKLNGQLAEAYFCPEDNCKAHVLKVLEKAESSIHFMTLSFTDDEIGNLLLDKTDSIEVKGIFDPKKDKYSEYEKLKDFSIIKSVHHKVFIVDGHTVITGSYNPTRNGNERNDENVVIVRDARIAEQFENEFARLFD